MAKRLSRKDRSTQRSSNKNVVKKVIEKKSTRKTKPVRQSKIQSNNNRNKNLSVEKYGMKLRGGETNTINLRGFNKWQAINRSQTTKAKSKAAQRNPKASSPTVVRNATPDDSEIKEKIDIELEMTSQMQSITPLLSTASQTITSSTVDILTPDNFADYMVSNGNSTDKISVSIQCSLISEGKRDAYTSTTAYSAPINWYFFKRLAQRLQIDFDYLKSVVDDVLDNNNENEQNFERMEDNDSDTSEMSLPAELPATFDFSEDDASTEKNLLYGSSDSSSVSASPPRKTIYFNQNLFVFDPIKVTEQK